MTLLLDLGNTRLKLARLCDGAARDAIAIAHADAGFDAALDAWLESRAAGEAPARAWLAAVAPDARITRVEAALARHAIGCVRVHTEADALGLRVAYADPRALGVDRWLGMLAARALGDGPWLVASVGTALTLDAVAADGGHLGGLIAPSPDAMRAALVARAPRLQLDGGEVHAFATSTADAIASGCTLAAVALIERGVEHLAQRGGGTPCLVLGGGGADALRAWLPAHCFVPHLVLDGLARWAQHAATRVRSRIG